MSSSKFLKPVKRVLRILPDRAYIQLYYLTKFGKFCRLRNPSTYSEKLQWLKLNYPVANDARLVDKSEVKGFVSESIGVQHVIPTLAVYGSADEIDFAQLPKSFVLKCTHDSEGVVIVTDKASANHSEIRKRLRKALKQNFFYVGREPHYRELHPRIIAEPYLEDAKHGQLLDYKFLCFDGEVKAMFVASDRASGHVKFDYFDSEYSPLKMRQTYPTSQVRPERPARFETMISIARTLSQGRPHVRVDLYEVDGEVYFGELTFFHFSGFAPFHPPEWDQIWGDWLSLPEPPQLA